MPAKFQILTRPNCRKLEPGQKLQEHGIGFDRLADGDGRWSVNFRVDGIRVHRYLGKESDGVTREQCEQFMEQARTDARRGRLNLPKGRKTALGFRQAAAQYLEKLVQEGGRDLVNKRKNLDLHLVPFFGDTPLSKIASFEIERYKKARREGSSKRGGDRVSQAARQQGIQAGGRATPVAKGSVNLELATLSHLFNKAVEWGWLDHKPAQVKKYKLDNARIEYLTTEQIGRLLAAAREDQCLDVYPFMVIGLETAMRKTEILSIRLEHIHLERRTISIPKAKAGAREQPITGHLAEFLNGYIESAEPGQEWLFPAKGRGSKSGHRVSIEGAFQRVVAAAGLDPKAVVRHTLRHTAITHLVQAGVDIPTVQRISGHKTISMVVRYAHANGDHIRAALDKLESRYRPAPGTPPKLQVLQKS